MQDQSDKAMLLMEISSFLKDFASTRTVDETILPMATASVQDYVKRNYPAHNADMFEARLLGYELVARIVGE